VDINKRFVYDGLARLVPGEVFIGKLDLFEYPTIPEPAGVALALESAAALAIAALIIRSSVYRTARIQTNSP
jgi:hypothetical protein